MKRLYVAILVLLSSCCNKAMVTTPPPPATAQVSAPEESDLDSVVRGAIDLGLGRPWDGIGTGYDIGQKEKTIVTNYQDIALRMLDHDLQSTDRYRRVNAYDYLDRLFITPGAQFDRAASIVLLHRAQEKDLWVSALADQIADYIEFKRSGTK